MHTMFKKRKFIVIQLFGLLCFKTKMPDTKRLPYPEASESYHLYLNDTTESKTFESDEILIQSNIVNNANGSAFIEYNDAKGKNISK